MRDVELDPPRPRTAVDRRTTMFASTPSTCTRRTLDLPRKDWDIRYLRYLGNSDIAQLQASPSLLEVNPKTKEGPLCDHEQRH